MKKILIIHLNQEDTTETVHFFDHELEILRRGCSGDAEKARELIRSFDGEVDAIGLEGMPSTAGAGICTA